MRHPLIALAAVALQACASTSLGSCGPPDWVRADPATEVSLYAVHGTGPADVWAVGDLGTILHFDGSGWTKASPVTQLNLRGVWAAGAKDVWAVGDQGVALHWDGKAWGRFDPGTSSDLVAVVAFAANDVWLLPESQHLLYHWDGTRFAQVDATTRTGSGKCLWGSAPGNLWLMPSYTRHAYLVTTAGLAEVPLDMSGDFDCRGISGQAPNDMWFVSDSTLLHFDGRLFRPSSPPPQVVYGVSTPSSASLRAVFAPARNEVWVVGSGGSIWHVADGTWSESTRFAYGAKTLNAVWGARTDDLWAVGADGMALRKSPPLVVP